MITRQLGANGPIASAIGLGCMGMSDLYGASDRAEGVATIHAALDAGVTLLDTGDFYGMGDNEMLIAEALRGRPRDGVILSVKFGAQRDPDGNWIGFDGRPSAVKTALAYSLKRLGVDYLDIYRPARLDPNVPIEETVGAIADMVKAGHVRFIGLSEVGPETIRRAAAVHPIADLQIEYSLISRGIESSILPTCRALGIGLTAYGVLSRGLISGHWQAGAQTGKRRFSREHSALSGRKPWKEFGARRGNQAHRRRQGRNGRAGRHRLGFVARRRHRAAHRRATARQARRIARRARVDARSRGPGRSGESRVFRLRSALREGADGASRQRRALKGPLRTGGGRMAAETRATSRYSRFRRGPERRCRSNRLVTIIGLLFAPNRQRFRFPHLTMEALDAATV